MQVAQDRRGDRGLGLGRGELVVLAAGEVAVAGSVDRVGSLGAPDRAPRREPQSGPALTGELGASDEGARQLLPRASPACWTSARAVANRVGSPVSARIAAAPTGDRPVMEVTSPVSSSSSRTV